MNLNKVIIVGRVTKDPEIRALPSGSQVASFGMATNRNWTKDGQKQQEVEFHNIVMFGKLADIAGRYVVKGALLLVEGRLKTQSWEKDGIKRYKTDIIAESMQLGPRAAGASGVKVDPAEIPVIDENSYGPQGELDVKDLGL